MQPVAEKLISKAKRGDLHSRRLVKQTITNSDIVHVLFAEIAPKMAGRDGGYTRITKVGPRKGDNAPMAIIELVTEPIKKTEPKKSTKKAETSAFKTVDQATADNADVDAPMDTADTEAVEPQAVMEAIDESAADVAETAATDEAKKDAAQA